MGHKKSLCIGRGCEPPPDAPQSPAASLFLVGDQIHTTEDASDCEEDSQDIQER